VPETESLRATVTRQEVQAELISRLYRRTRPLLISNFAAIFVMLGALWNNAERAPLVVWAFALGVWTLLRFLIAHVYLRRPRPAEEAALWAYTFTIGASIAGCLWGCSILLIGNIEADNIKVVAAFLMAALSAAAMAGYTNSLLAFTAFLTPAVLPFAIRLVYIDGSLHFLIAGFVVFWAWLLWSMAQHLNESLKDSIGLTMQNARLIERLSRAKERAEAANLAKTRFLANMSHELRTPLNAIIGYSDMIHQKILGPLGHTTYESYNNHVLDSGKHLLRIVDQVLDISRIEAGTIELARERVRVNDLVGNAVGFVAAAAAEDTIEIATRVAPNLPEVTGDAARLRQVLLNLLSNAVKFTPPKGRIDVTAELVSEGVNGYPSAGMVLSVADTGIGIAPEQIEKVTMPFRLLENQDHMRRVRPLKHDVGQTDAGLGLPLARLLVELHGGKLEIASAPGQGTRVSVWLPESRLARPANEAREARIAAAE